MVNHGVTSPEVSEKNKSHEKYIPASGSVSDTAVAPAEPLCCRRLVTVSGIPGARPRRSSWKRVLTADSGSARGRRLPAKAPPNGGSTTSSGTGRSGGRSGAGDGTQLPFEGTAGSQRLGDRLRDRRQPLGDADGGDGVSTAPRRHEGTDRGGTPGAGAPADRRGRPASPLGRSSVRSRYKE